MTPPATSSYGDCLAASGNDPFVRWQIDPARWTRGWVLDGAVAFERSGSGRDTLVVIGSPPAAARALQFLVPAGNPTVVTVPRGTLSLLSARVGDGADWEWMLTDVRPAVSAAAQRVADLEDMAEVTQLLEVANPRHSARPGNPAVLRWVGVHSGEGALVACAAHTQEKQGVAHLASIATHPAARGQGLGELVTGTLTGSLFDAGSPVVTLGMYSDNDVARRMYARLGFTCEHRWSSYAIIRR